MTKLKPLLLTYSDADGAGTATKRIHEGLLKNGISSQMLVQEKKSNEPTIVGPDSFSFSSIVRLRSAIDTLPLGMYGFPNEFSLGWTPDQMSKRVTRYNPDVVHLNWVAGGYMNVKSISKIDQPIIWRLPDMWPLTGGCHYAEDCTKYQSRCGKCPQLGSDYKKDLSYIMQRRKKGAVSDSDVTVVATTSWLALCAEQSSIFEDCRIEIIPNGLDTDLYRPYPAEIGRDLFNLPKDTPLILFGAVSPVANPRKGFQHLRKAIRIFAETTDTDAELVVFGGEDIELSEQFPLPIHSVGYISNEQKLAKLYAAADVMVVPSRYEGFGQTVTESMAAGTPVVAFDTTGPSDTVEHKQTGYLAKPYEEADLADGIEHVLQNNRKDDKYSRKSRQRAVSEYHYTDIAEQYYDLYKSVI